MTSNYIFGMSEEEEGQTSGEEEDRVSKESANVSVANDCKCEWREKIINEVNKFTAEWSDSSSSSDDEDSYCQNVMYFLSARCVVGRMECDAQYEEPLFELGGVRVGNARVPMEHQPVVWNVYGFSSVLKVVLKPIGEISPVEHCQRSVDQESLLAYLRGLIISATPTGTQDIKDANDLVASITECPISKIKDIWRITGSLATELIQCNSKLLEIQLKNIKVSKVLCRLLERKGTSWSCYHILPFEENINQCRRFLAQRGLRPSSFIECQQPPAGNNIQYKLQLINGKSVRVAFVHYSCITPSSAVHGTNLMALLRVLSFDLECLVPDEISCSQSTTQRSLKFNELGNIILIGLQVAEILISPDSEKADFVRQKKFLCCAGECSNGIEGATVFQVFPENMDGSDNISNSNEDMDANEVVLLSLFQYLVTTLNPDIMTGYNITQFDLPYINFRSNLLREKYKIKHVLTNFGRSSSLSFIEGTLSKHRRPRNHSIYCKVAGRSLFDMYLYLCLYSSETGKGKLSLKAVARRNLPLTIQKLEIPGFPQVAHWRNGANRRDLGLYCLRDVEMPMELMIKENLPDTAARKVFSSPIVHALKTSRQLGITVHQILNKSESYHRWCGTYYVHCANKM